MEPRRCFGSKPRQRNPINDDTHISPEESQRSSTMRSEYMPPSIYGSERKDIAKRRALFRSKVVAEMIKEIEQENLIKDPVEPYCTTYDDLFQIPGFKADDKSPENTELYLKYPLYSCQPITFYSEVVASKPKNKPTLPGMTSIKNLGSPFLKNGAFTTPVHLRFDDSEN